MHKAPLQEERGRGQWRAQAQLHMPRVAEDLSCARFVGRLLASVQSGDYAMEWSEGGYSAEVDT